MDEDDHVLISSFALSLQLPELQFGANLRYKYLSRVK
jgi:hypothetical protein